MGNPIHPKPVKLIASLICNQAEFFYLALKKMIIHWGDIDFVSEIMDFDFTHYYEPEMGKNLWRRIISFKTLISPDKIANIKHLTNQIEKSLSSKPKKRSVNIDPGYINEYHLILSTTKPCPHRPYLNAGIYADLTLIYKEKSFHALPWTYPDYRSEEIIAIMNSLRSKYLFQLRKGLFWNSDSDN